MIQKLIQKANKSGNIYSLAGNLVYAFFSFITFLIMVRVLDKTIYGQWVIFVTIATLLDMLRLGLTGTAAIRLIARSEKLEHKKIIGASYQLSTWSTLIIIALFSLVYFFIDKEGSKPEYLSVLMLYPLLALSNLPYHQANIVTQGKLDFKSLMILKSLNGILIFIAINIYIFSAEGRGLLGIITVYILANLITSIVAVLFKWDGIGNLFVSAKNSRKEILHFGKYSTASYIGSNLLRSSDTIILSLAVTMGPTAVAILSIPLKFIEFVEIPLRSFTVTAFPRLSRAFEEKSNSFSTMLLNYSFTTTIMLIPVAIILSIFPMFFLKLIGGMEYANAIDLQVQILYVVCIYILILPFDRYTGVALFAIDRPDLNFYKILFMLIANIIFDLIAVFVFQSLLYVAIATVFFTLLGILFGWYFLHFKSGIKLSLKSYLLAADTKLRINALKKW